MNIDRILLALIFICVPKICLGSDSWTFSTYDNTFLECDRNNNFDACIFLLHQDFNPIDPDNSDMKYRIAEEAINEGNEVVGFYLLLKSCGQNNIRACSRYNEYITFSHNMHSQQQDKSQLDKERQLDMDDSQTFGIVCSHIRDYNDKRTDPDAIERLYKYAGELGSDPMNYDLQGNPDLATTIISSVAVIGKLGKKAIKPINHDKFFCKSKDDLSLDELISSNMVIPLALYSGAVSKYSEKIDNPNIKREGKIINFTIPTIKSDLDYFGFYIPENDAYILWEFSHIDGNFYCLDDVIYKNNRESGWNKIKDYID